jgi:3-hydroxyisobutyrate dehydrogenase-like beta-hydroxyacid dehydrogenase
VIVGLVHPGEMGAALGAALQANGHDVLWAEAGRSEATRRRAARFRDAGRLAALVRESELILSVCPPHAALEVALAARPFDGVYVDANAVSPATARRIAAVHARFVDGGIIGGPPREPGTTRLYLSGPEAPAVAELFAGSVVEAVEVGDASALKMTYAAWSKGGAALLLAIRHVARASGVWDDLLEEWQRSAPELLERLAAAERSAGRKGWRWIGEMEQIAATFADFGAPAGFHLAAAEVFRAAEVART